MTTKPRRWIKFRSDYWLRTYVELNPFMGAPRCPECDELPVFELSPDKWLNPATSQTAFKCKHGHVFTRNRTHD